MPHVFAAGDCVETWHRLLNCYTYLPLGTTAHKQGRIAGENAIGGSRAFAGSLGTQVVKVFDLVVARTGLNDAEARQAGLDPLTVEEKVWDHKVYYPGAKHLHIQVCGDRRTGKLLGAQMAGHIDAEVSKRVDIFASALFHGMLVEDLNDLDLSYTPPLSAPLGRRPGSRSGLESSGTAIVRLKESIRESEPSTTEHPGHRRRRRFGPFRTPSSDREFVWHRARRARISEPDENLV